MLGRFNNLFSDVQRMLRTASVIGATFSSKVLGGVLPPQLVELMPAGLDVLLAQKWIYQDAATGFFQFANPHVHKVIYQLTPSSERSNLHQLIADHIEETFGEDETQYGALSFHYQYCDTDKALRYCVKATAVQLKTNVDRKSVV